MILSMHQPEYLPYLGHIAKIAQADIHIFYDDVQYERGGYQNRNRIWLEKKWGWITVPVVQKFKQKIYEVGISGDRWRHDHAKTLKQYYSSCALDEIYDRHWDTIADLNIAVTTWILRNLKIEVRTLRSKDLAVQSKDRMERVIEICKKVGATVFVSGMGAKKYLNEKKFRDNGIQLIYSDWRDSLCPPLSTVHYLFSEGNQSVRKRILCHIRQLRKF